MNMTEKKDALLLLLVSFFITFIVMMVLFRINWLIFEGYMGMYWANLFGIELIPSIWGWIFIAITIALGAASFYLLFSDKSDILTKLLMILTGVFLQLLLYGINTKFIW